MKIKTIVLICLLVCFTITIQAQKLETKTHTVKNVTSIAISGNVDIYITQGDSKTVKIEATEKQHEKMKAEIKDNSVSVSCKDGKKNEKPVKVYVSVQNLKALASSTGGDVYFENTIKSKELNIALSSGSDLVGAVDVEQLSCAASSGSDIDLKDSKANKMQIATSGGSDLVAKGIDVKKMSLVISGGSDVDISGNCDDLNLVASGGSDCTASSFKTEKCNVVVSGGSDANIHVTEELSIIASGASDINCKGNPEIVSKKISKSSDFNMK